MDIADLETLLGEPIETDTFRDVWVVLDQPALSLVGYARTLADALGAYVRVVRLGESVASDDAIASGADYVYEAPAAARAGGLAGLLGPLFEQEEPEIILVPEGLTQNEAAARLAVRLGAGLVADAFNLRLDESTRRITASRQVYHGDYSLALRITTPVQIFTLDPLDYPEPYPDPDREGEIIPVPAPNGRDTPPGSSKTPEVFRPTAAGPANGFAPPTLPLRKARRIVSVGRGVKDEETLALVRELAGRLDAHLAGDRGALDRGWIGRDQVIGIHGEDVAPDLYLAVGIHGDTLHNAGMERARHIVAIHSDPQAPFLQLADEAIVADPKEFLPVLLTIMER